MPTYNPPSDCTPVARCYVGGEQIPLVNDGAVIERRKQGPLDVQATLHAYFPAIGPDGGDWVTDLSEGKIYDPVDVELLDPTDGTYFHAFHGLVQGIGAGNKTENEMRLVGVDPAIVLDKIHPHYDWRGYDLGEALSEVTDDITEFVPGVDVVPVIDDKVAEYTPDRELPLDPLHLEKSIEEGFGLNKNFQPNKHTLGDVFRYLTKETNFFYAFNTRGGDIGSNVFPLVVDDDPTDRTYVADDFGGNVVFLENNMVAEINPVNAIELRGKLVEVDTSGSTSGTQPPANENVDSPFVDDTPETEAFKYPIATAVHRPTLDLAGERVHMPPVGVQDDTSDVATLKRRAKRKLKDELDGVGHGNATAQLNPHLFPYTIIEAPPYCNENAPTFRYEVESVTHHAGTAYEERNGVSIPTTEFQASFAVEKSDIEIVQPTGYRVYSGSADE